MGTFGDHEQNAAYSWSGSDVIRALTEIGQLFIFSYSPRLRTLLSWSDNAEELLGTPPTNLARDGNLFLRHIHVEDRFRVLNELEAALAGERPLQVSYRWIKPNNDQQRILHCRAAVNSLAPEDLFEGFIIDLGDSINAELTDQPTVSQILRSHDHGSLVLDRDLRIVDAWLAPDLPAFKELNSLIFRSNTLNGHTLESCIKDPKFAQEISAGALSILGGESRSFAHQLSTSTAHYQLALSALGSLDNPRGILITITDRLEQDILARRISALEQARGLSALASGIARSVSNLLDASLGDANSILNNREQMPITSEAAKGIINRLNRALKLTEQLIKLERFSEGVFSPTDVNLAVVSALQSFPEFFSGGRRVNLSLSSSATVLSNPEKLSELVKGILAQFRDRSSGDISLKIREKDLQENEIDRLPSGRYVRISFLTDQPHLEISSGSSLFDHVHAVKGAVVLSEYAGGGSALRIYLPCDLDL